MKKSVGILSGLVVAIAVATVAGAWYTGERLPAELQRAVEQGNHELSKAAVGTGGSVTLELASLERHWFSSVAHYRLIARNVSLGAEPLNLDVGIVDRIEHGPFPWSRVKRLQLLPVMAASNSELERSEQTQPWFDAAGGTSPLKAHTALGYAGGVNTELEMLPVKFTGDDGSAVDFSGLKLAVDGDREGSKAKIHADAQQLQMTLVVPEQLPVKFQLDGMKLGGELERKNKADFFFGHIDMSVDEMRMVFGPEQKTLLFKGVEQNNVYTAEGEEHLGGSVEYKTSEISYDGRALGSAAMVMSFKSLDVPALQSLTEWYQQFLPEMQQAAAEGRQFVPTLSPEDKPKVHADLHKALSAKPQIALEQLSFKTARGESRLVLKTELRDPASFDVPSDQLAREIVGTVHGKLVLSKPMIADLVAFQGLLEGQADPQTIALQSNQAGEMVGVMAVQSGLATAQGDDVLASFDYADGAIEFNGQKMTVEQFAAFLQARLGMLAPRG